MNLQHVKGIAFLSMTFILALGCAQNSQPDYGSLNLVDISGTVRMEGKALANMEIRFVDMEEGIYSFGVTDDNGKYKLMLDSRKSGIIPGKKRVLFVAKSKGEADMSQEDAEAESKSSVKAKGSVVPACYGQESKIEVEVKGADPQFDFDLKQDCSTLDRS